MSTRLRWLAAMTVLGLSGCYPEERIWWSPKGDRAIVLVEDDQLHLVKPDGELGVALLGGESVKDMGVMTLDWLPDGKSIVLGRKRLIRTWEETCRVIPADEAKLVEERVPQILSELKLELSRFKDKNKLESLNALLRDGDQMLAKAGLRLLFERRSEEVKAALEVVPLRTKIVSELESASGGFEVFELIRLHLDEPKGSPPKTIVCSLLSLAIAPRVSPRHDAVAFLRVREGDEEDSATLCVTPIEGGRILEATRGVVSIGFRWMPDGRTLIFTKPLSGDGDSIQSIQKVTVMEELGELMKPSFEIQPNGSHLKMEGKDRISDPVPLALAVLPERSFTMGTALQALPDGRILFASPPVTLPALPGPELVSQLHLISADGKSLSTVPTTPGDLPADLQWFLVSPDGKHVAVSESATDAVAVVEISTGKTEIISSSNSGWRSETIPAWRSATELTYVAFDPVAKTPRWMQWSAKDGTQCISKNWPANSTASWMKAPKTESPTDTKK